VTFDEIRKTVRGEQAGAFSMAILLDWCAQYEARLASEEFQHRELRGNVRVYSEDICRALGIKDGGITPDRDPVVLIGKLKRLVQLTERAVAALDGGDSCPSCGRHSTHLKSCPVGDFTEARVNEAALHSTSPHRAPTESAQATTGD
jgi:hypothetical protein